MMKPQKFSDEVLSVYANNLMSGVFKNINIVKQALEKNTFPIDFPEKDRNVIINELLYYFLNICDRVLYDIYDHEIKTRIMDSLVCLIAKALDDVKNDIMDKQLIDLGGLKELGVYLKVLRTTYDSQEFTLTFNKRQKEYEGYLSPHENTNKDMDKALEKEYVNLVKPQIGLKDRPITKVDTILWSIPMETHFYKQLYKIIPKIEHHVKLSEKEN